MQHELRRSGRGTKTQDRFVATRALLVGALAVLATATAGAQVIQRRIPRSAPPVPTEPQKTQEATAADQAAKDATGNPTPTDPAGVPPGGTPSDTPPTNPPPTIQGDPNASSAPPASRDPGVRGALVPAPARGTGAIQLGAGSPAAMMASWERLAGCAKRISIAALTQIYVVGCADGPDILIYRWIQDHWESAGVSGVSVAAVSNLPQGGAGSTAPPFSGGIPITHAETAQTGGVQEQASGGGWLWVIQSPSGDHWGGQVLRTNCRPLRGSEECDFKAFGATYMKRIAAGLSDGIAWAIGEDGRIFRQVDQGEGWLLKPGCATSIANAGGDRVWVIGCNEPDAEGNHPIYRWTGSDWERVAGFGKEIAVQPDDRPWVLTGDGGVWRRR